MTEFETWERYNLTKNVTEDTCKLIMTGMNTHMRCECITEWLLPYNDDTDDQGYWDISEYRYMRGDDLITIRRVTE